MSNTKENERISKQAFDELMAMDLDEFDAYFEAHKDGDIADIIMHSGMVIKERKPKEE